MRVVRANVGLTRFDPITNTPGTADYVNRARQPIRGQLRNSVVTRGTGTYSAGAVERRGEPWAVPSLPRRNYIPTVSRVELD